MTSERASRERPPLDYRTAEGLSQQDAAFYYRGPAQPDARVGADDRGPVRGVELAHPAVHLAL